MPPEDPGGSPAGAVPAHEVLNLRRRQVGVTVEQLWISYFELTGDASLLELDAYLHGSLAMPALQVEILRHALVECVDDPGRPPAMSRPWEQ